MDAFDEGVSAFTGDTSEVADTEQEQSDNRQSSAMRLKVYAPDMQSFSLEGNSGLFGTIATLIVGPFRVMSRVMHNIMIMPVDIARGYCSALFFVNIVFFALGLVDYFFYKKWPLLTASILAFLIFARMKSKCSTQSKVDEYTHEVEIDAEQVEDLLNSIYDDLDAMLGIKEENR